MQDDTDEGPLELTAERREIRRPARRSRIWITIVALAAFGVFTWYAYHQATKAGEGGVAPLIKAEEGPSRVKPDDPGGMDVPHQDKAVYERLGNEDSAPSAKTESLLPPPESPMPHPTTAANAAEGGLAPAAGPAASPAVTQTMAAPPPPAPAATSPAKPSAVPPPASAAAKSVPAAPPADTKTAAVAPSTLAAPAAPVAPPADSSAAKAGDYRVQLSAVHSPDAADTEWKKLQKAYPDLLGTLTLNVVKADLGEKGTFYRVQAGSLSESAAKDLCTELKRRKAECIVVKS
jgi:hypothetical protein